MATSRSAQSCVLDLLRYVGIVGFAAVDNDQALNRPGIDSDDVNRAIGAVNAALQTIQRFGPQSLKEARRSATFEAPASLSLTINVSSNRKSAVATTTPPAWMLGCSIWIAGDTELNRIMAITGSTITLLRGYLGASASGIGATVYSDCALLEADVAAVLEPVHVTGNIRLIPSENLEEFERLYRRCWDYACGNGYAGNTIQSITSALGTPGRYLVERERDGIPFLRVAPMPGAAINATFKAKLRAERITVAVLDQTGGADPNYFFKSVHDDEVETILLPLARWEFFSHPALKNAETRNTVEKKYNEVMVTLRAGTTLEPSVGRSRARYT